MIVPRETETVTQAAESWLGALGWTPLLPEGAAEQQATGLPFWGQGLPLHLPLLAQALLCRNTVTMAITALRTVVTEATTVV